MRVAVLGATGFIGSWAVRALIASGHDVTAFARPSSDIWRLTGVRGAEVLQSGDWAESLRGGKHDAVLSLDWSGVSASDRDNEAAQEANLFRQAELIAAAVQGGVVRYVGVGSQAEYGPVHERVAESHALAPSTAYGKAKVAARTALESAAATTSIDWAWARVFSVFGPLETGSWLLPRIAAAAATGTSLELSSGEQRWSYLFAADAGSALAQLVVRTAASGVYNVGHPSAPPLRESVEIFARALDSPGAVVFGTSRGLDLEPDTSRLQSLGWAPQWSAEEALGVTAEWLSGDTVADPFQPGATLPLQR